jgi:hypothetical protein
MAMAPHRQPPQLFEFARRAGGAQGAQRMVRQLRLVRGHGYRGGSTGQRFHQRAIGVVHVAIRPIGIGPFALDEAQAGGGVSQARRIVQAAPPACGKDAAGAWLFREQGRQISVDRFRVLQRMRVEQERHGGGARGLRDGGEGGLVERQCGQLGREIGRAALAREQRDGGDVLGRHGSGFRVRPRDVTRCYPDPAPFEPPRQPRDGSRIRRGQQAPQTAGKGIARVTQGGFHAAHQAPVPGNRRWRSQSLPSTASAVSPAMENG